MEKTIEKKRKTNLDDEIYLLTYGLPYYKDQLSKAIYGVKGHPTIISKLKKLEERNWIKICKYEDAMKSYHNKVLPRDGEKPGDKRRNRRQYIIANPDILLEKICARLRFNECELTADEKNELKNYLTSPHFLDKIQSVIEMGYKIPNEILTGEIQDVFYSMLNFILLDSVYYISLYQIVDETLHDAGLMERGTFIDDIQKNFQRFHEKWSHDVPLRLSLMKKLCKLDIHTANKLMMQYVTFGDRIISFYEYPRNKKENF